MNSWTQECPSCTQKREYVSVLISPFCCVRLCATPWTEAHPAPLSMGFSRQEYRSALPCPPSGDLPNPERPRCSALRTSFERAQNLKPWNICTSVYWSSSRFLCSWPLWLLPTLNVILFRSEMYNFDTKKQYFTKPLLMCLFGGVLWILHVTNSPTWPGPANEVGDGKDWLLQGPLSPHFLS